MDGIVATSFNPSEFTMSQRPSFPFKLSNPSGWGTETRSTTGWRWASWVAVAAVTAALIGCDGDQDNDTAVPTAWSAAQAVQTLIDSPKSYPAALAVRVSSTAAEVEVAGVQTVGGAPLRSAEAFPVGSLTKSMTATLAAVLVQEGRVSWQSRLLDVFPELATTARPEYARVTLQDLLTHRGGMFPATSADQLQHLPSLSGTPAQQREALLGWMLNQPSSSSPGVRTQYSNGDYVAAAAMLERVTGQAYESMLSSRVFALMGVSVSFGTPGAVAGEPWGHSRTGTGWAPVSPEDPEAQYPAFANPAGGAKLDAAALATYLRMHLRAYRGMDGEVLTPETARTLHTVVQDGFALGWQAGADLLGQPIHWHNGSDDASYYALMAMSLTTDRAAAVVVTGLSGTTEADLSEATVRMLR